MERRSNLEILGLDLMQTGDGRCFLIELNSAPGIGPYTAQKVWEFIQYRYFAEE